MSDPVQLLIATRNRGKIREFSALFADLPGLALRTLDDVPPLPEVEEDGATFEDNAQKKARVFAQASGMLALSDDSGLEVDALGGAPGVYSARYAGESADDHANNQKLIAALADVPRTRRSARYRVVLALADPAGPLGTRVHCEQGACEGHIELTPAGEHGFGYDPYFQPAGYDCRMAELPPEEKNRISHRAQAARKMREFLAGYLPERAAR